MTSIPDTQIDIDELTRRLRVLEDKEALRTLLTRGWRALDEQDWDTWSACWADDAVFDFGPWGATRGRTAIREVVVAAEEGYAAMQHHILNMQFEVDGDRAMGIGYMWFVAIADAAAPGQHLDLGGPYEWELVRTDEGWRVQVQKLSVAWSAGQDPLGSF